MEISKFPGREKNKYCINYFLMMSCGFTIHMPHFPILLVRSKVKVITLCI